MRPVLAPLLAALSALASLPAAAQKPAPFGVVLSEGASTCGEFTAQPAMQTIRMEWVLGYISGLNAGLARSGNTDFSQTGAGRSFQMPATAVGWLQSYCAAHPLDVLLKAAEELRNDFIAHERGIKPPVA